MTGQPLFTHHPFTPPGATATHVELADRRLSVTGPERLHAQMRRRHNNDRAIIENPLAHLTDEALAADVSSFAKACLPDVDPEKLLRAARVAKDIRTYDEVARSPAPDAGFNLPVVLSPEEKRSLKAEKDSLRVLEKGMVAVILTVSLAAFLQGHVQSSLNGSVPYLGCIFNTHTRNGQCNPGISPEQNDVATTSDAQIGAVNSAPFFFAAAVGCPLSLPVNDLVGRKGAIAIAALLIFVSSLASPFVTNWHGLFGVRVINGIGMGIKAVSTPILASEASIGFWRGSSLLAWQLWVAFGIMIGFVLNLIFSRAQDNATVGKLILGAPFVPSLILLVGLYFCPESPRYYMRSWSSSYDPSKAYRILRRLRKTELQALRDLYLVYKSIEQENDLGGGRFDHPERLASQGLLDKLADYFRQYKELFGGRRTGGRRRRNALISSSTVNLAQQLCGINIMAFYSTTLFQRTGSKSNVQIAMLYSFGYGAINFFFGLPAIRTIDTLGRRKWLTITLPPMTIFMLAAALSNYIVDEKARGIVIAVWLFLFAAAYSPGLGPMPFTLASESFPLSHREAGCAFAIAVNLLFAGVLSISFPPILTSLGNARVLFIFAGLNLLAFILVFTLVEETKRRSLEDLDLVFAVSKRRHIRYQVGTYLPWFVRYYLFGQRDRPKPSLYVDLIWGGSVDRGHNFGGQPGDEGEAEQGRGQPNVRGDDRPRESDCESVASSRA